MVKRVITDDFYKEFKNWCLYNHPVYNDEVVQDIWDLWADVITKVLERFCCEDCPKFEYDSKMKGYLWVSLRNAFFGYSKAKRKEWINRKEITEDIAQDTNFEEMAIEYERDKEIQEGYKRRLSEVWEMVEEKFSPLEIGLYRMYILNGYSYNKMAEITTFDFQFIQNSIRRVKLYIQQNSENYYHID